MSDGEAPVHVIAIKAEPRILPKSEKLQDEESVKSTLPIGDRKELDNGEFPSENQMLSKVDNVDMEYNEKINKQTLSDNPIFGPNYRVRFEGAMFKKKYRSSKKKSRTLQNQIQEDRVPRRTNQKKSSSKSLKKETQATGTIVCAACGKSFQSEKSFCHHRDIFCIANEVRDQGVNDSVKGSRKKKFGFEKHKNDTRKNVIHEREQHMKPPKKKVYKCVMCRTQFKDAAQFKLHVFNCSRYMTYGCVICEQSYPFKKLLEHHLSLIHGIGRDFNCSVCSRSFKCHRALIEHNRSHTGERPFICEKCGKTFRRQNTLTRHMVTHNETKMFCCEICGQRFTTSLYVKTHMLVHSGEKPHQCDICGKFFRHESGLRAHKVSHTELRPHKCKECGLTFRNTGNLTEHKRKHTGEKPFKCDLCPKAFARSNHLTRHKKAHEKKEAKIRATKTELIVGKNSKRNVKKTYKQPKHAKQKKTSTQPASPTSQKHYRPRRSVRQNRKKGNEFNQHLLEYPTVVKNELPVSEQNNMECGYEQELPVLEQNNMECGYEQQPFGMRTVETTAHAPPNQGYLVHPQAAIVGNPVELQSYVRPIYFTVIDQPPSMIPVASPIEPYVEVKLEKWNLPGEPSIAATKGNTAVRQQVENVLESSSEDNIDGAYLRSLGFSSLASSEENIVTSLCQSISNECHPNGSYENLFNTMNRDLSPSNVKKENNPNRLELCDTDPYPVLPFDNNSPLRIKSVFGSPFSQKIIEEAEFTPDMISISPLRSEMEELFAPSIEIANREGQYLSLTDIMNSPGTDDQDNKLGIRYVENSCNNYLASDFSNQTVPSSKEIPNHFVIPMCISRENIRERQLQENHYPLWSDMHPRTYSRNVSVLDKKALNISNVKQCNNSKTGKNTNFLCDICGKELHRKSRLLRHKRTHFLRIPRYDGETFIEGNSCSNDEKKLYHCVPCNRAFERLFDFEYHKEKECKATVRWQLGLLDSSSSEINSEAEIQHSTSASELVESGTEMISVNSGRAQAEDCKSPLLEEMKTITSGGADTYTPRSIDETLHVYECMPVTQQEGLSDSCETENHIKNEITPTQIENNQLVCQTPVTTGTGLIIGPSVQFPVSIKNEANEINAFDEKNLGPLPTNITRAGNDTAVENVGDNVTRYLCVPSDASEVLNSEISQEKLVPNHGKEHSERFIKVNPSSKLCCTNAKSDNTKHYTLFESSESDVENIVKISSDEVVKISSEEIAKIRSDEVDLHESLRQPNENGFRTEIGACGNVGHKPSVEPIENSERQKSQCESESAIYSNDMQDSVTMVTELHLSSRDENVPYKISDVKQLTKVQWKDIKDCSVLLSRCDSIENEETRFINGEKSLKHSKVIKKLNNNGGNGDEITSSAHFGTTLDSQKNEKEKGNSSSNYQNSTKCKHKNMGNKTTSKHMLSGPLAENIILHDTGDNVEHNAVSTELDTKYVNTRIQPKSTIPKDGAKVKTPVSGKNVCRYCSRKFANRSNLTRHQKIHLNKKDFMCDYCNKLFHTRHNLKEHLRKHTGDRPYECRNCNRKFKYHSNLRIHSSDFCKHEPTQFTAILSPVGKGFKRKQKFSEIELQLMQSVTCDICGKIFATRPNMVRHKKIHAGNRGGSIQFVCHLCGAMLLDKDDIKRHQKEHLQVGESSGQNDYLKCQLCCRSFSNGQQFEDHLFQDCKRSYKNLTCKSMAS